MKSQRVSRRREELRLVIRTVVVHVGDKAIKIGAVFRSRGEIDSSLVVDEFCQHAFPYLV